MTAEVALYNSQSVALAADSLVTISTGDGPRKTHSVHKLFTLSKHWPIGFMTYGNGTPCGIPWETLIKHIRSQLGTQSFSTTLDYYNWFTGQLTIVFRSVKREEQEQEVHNMTLLYFRKMRRRFEDVVKSKLLSASGDVRLMFESFVADLASELNRSERISQEARDTEGLLRQGFVSPITAAIAMLSTIYRLPIKRLGIYFKSPLNFIRPITQVLGAMKQEW